MAKSVIHVNRQNIAYNAKIGEDILPVYTVKTGSGPARYGYGVKINGPSELVDPRVRKQLSCGARAWIETEAEVELVGEMSWPEVVALKDAH